MKNPLARRTAAPQTAAAPAKPTTGARRGPRPRRSPLILLLGVVLAAAGAIASAAIYSHIGQTQEIIAVVSGVYRGEQIERSDLAIVQVRADPTLATVPGTDIDQVVGSYALYDLAPGSTLPSGVYGERPQPPADHSEIGLVLDETQFPNTGLRPGDKVRLVNCSLTTGGSTGFDATLWTLDSIDASGTLRASVIVDENNADEVTNLAATGNLALALTARGGR